MQVVACGESIYMETADRISRRSLVGGLVAAPLLAASPSKRANLASSPPNLLFIVLDDMNDWIGSLKGHPQASTPNMDALAKRGTNFTNAHCQAPLCNPSRASFLTGLRPSTTGIYGLSPSHRSVPALRDHVTMPEHFTNNGYTTIGLGKVYHMLEGQHRSREFQIWREPKFGPSPPKRLGGGDFGGTLVDWGIFPEKDEDLEDYKLADAAIEQLRMLPHDKPFLLAVGFSCPHVPCYAPAKWFDRIPLNEVVLPKIKHGDRRDTPEFSWYLHWKLPEPRLAYYEKLGELPARVRAYLAVTSYIDAQIGRVLNALEETGRMQNTIVVLIGDNGYHFGEKEITGKNSLWDRATHVPLIMAGPGIPKRSISDPAELLDIYPTLVELAKLPARTGLEGRSLVPQMHGQKRTAPAITTANQGNHGIRTDRWRYIRYADGSEELYDMRADPNEWTNLANDPEYRQRKEELTRWLPKIDVPHAPGSAMRILTRSADGGWLWEGTPIIPGQIPMEPYLGVFPPSK
ncbi:MAG: arylsulfatase family protein [Acidobacteria bacterium]|nr:arylsulfatase family protein [Acidobacteriota bacterium]